MKNLLLTVILLCFCLPFVKAADQKMILISTNETDYQPVDGKYILAQERKIISNQLSPSSITTET